jgi:cytochrome c oxidase subunit II
LSSTSTAAPARRRRSGLRLAVGAAAVALLTSGCDLRSAYENSASLGFPDPITDEGQRIYDLWLGSVAAGAVVALVVWGLIFWAVVKYRKNSDELPRQVRYNLPVEVLYTVVPFIIIAVLFFYTAVDENYVNKTTAKPDVVVDIVGFQWNWQFAYEGVNGPDGGQARMTGVPGQPAELVLPTDRTIRFVETSNDVIHSFWVPKFLFKRDVVPGRANQFELTIRKEGRYIGRCAELCGEKHDRMNFYVKVVSPQAYDAYIASLKQGAVPGVSYVTAQPVGSSS